MSSIVRKILSDPTLGVDDKVHAVTTSLYALPDHGIAAALDFIFSTDDPNAATYPGNYLALLPDIAHEKQRVVEYFLEKRKGLLIAGVRLVRDMPKATVDKLVQVYLSDPTLEAMDCVIYELAMFFPEQLRMFAGRISDEDIQKAILAGGPDEWATDLARKYFATLDPVHLRDLGRFHTDRAVSLMLDLWPTVPEEDRSDLYACIESSGVFPDSRKASIYGTTNRGRVVDRATSPHAMGGGFHGSVPACAVCSTRANRILTLKTNRLGFELRGVHDPSFFWIACDHPQDYVVVRITPAGAEGIMTPTSTGPAAADVVPGQPALALEPHPNQFGYGMDVVPGFGLHQVGGYPPWINLARFPCCPLCGDAMRYLVSIDSGMTPFGRIALDGVLYGFWCESCSVSATMMQSG